MSLRWLFLLVLAVCGPSLAAGKRSVAELAAASDAIVHGRVVRHWSAWDASRQNIWTHYVVEPIDVLQGRAGTTYTVSEPGGVAGDVGMDFSGSVPFADAEEVLVFLRRVPNGMLRVTGHEDGKYTVWARATGRQRRAAAADPAELVRLKTEIRAALRARGGRR